MQEQLLERLQSVKQYLVTALSSVSKVAKKSKGGVKSAGKGVQKVRGGDSVPRAVRDGMSRRITAIALDPVRVFDTVTHFIPPLDIPPGTVSYMESRPTVILARHEKSEEGDIDPSWVEVTEGWLYVVTRADKGGKGKWEHITSGWSYIPPTYITSPESQLAEEREEMNPRQFLDSVVSMDALQVDLTRTSPRKLAYDTDLREYRKQLKGKSGDNDIKNARGLVLLVVIALVAAIVMLTIILLGQQQQTSIQQVPQNDNTPSDFSGGRPYSI